MKGFKDQHLKIAGWSSHTVVCCCLRFTSRSAITKVRQEGDSRREAGGQIQIKGILLGTSPRKKSNTADDSDF